MFICRLHHAPVFLYTLLHLTGAASDLKHIDDSLMFSINWPGSTADDIGNGRLASDQPDLTKQEDQESLWVVSADNERYQCMLPKTLTSKTDADRSTPYTGPSPLMLLKPLFTRMFCSYKLEQYWTYELCHGKSIRQYHEENQPSKNRQFQIVLQQFHLGRYDADKMEKDEAEYLQQLKSRQEASNKKVRPPTMRLEGLEMPYFTVNMTDGTMCDINNVRRMTSVLYVCSEDSRNDILSLEEVSTCEYQVVVLTPYLCAHPDYRLDFAPENHISCIAKDGAPTRPKRMVLMDQEAHGLLYPEEQSPRSPRENRPTVVDPVSVGGSGAPPHDPKLLQDFLSGEHCLTGGVGWWKYEFCYGKRVTQFHEEKDKPRTSILLGTWDKKSHVTWIEERSERKPKKGKIPKYVTHFYSGGDFCDATKKPRAVEVRLRCKDVKGHPDSVSLYLLEPRTCEYILGVESPIICNLLHNLDEHGLQQVTSDS